MAARDDLNAAIRAMGPIQRDPGGHQRIAIQFPDVTGVLVPRQVRALPAGLFIIMARKIEMLACSAVVAVADFAKQGPCGSAPEPGLRLEALDLAIASVASVARASGSGKSS